MRQKEELPGGRAPEPVPLRAGQVDICSGLCYIGKLRLNVRRGA